MKRFLFYLFFICFPLFSCSSGTIPPKDLSAIIADMYLADGAATSDYAIVQKADSVAIYESVIVSHGYTKEQFLASINKLVERPGKLRIIYENAKQELIEKQKIVAKDLSSSPENAVSPVIMEIIYDINQGKYINRYQRTLRWITYPFNFIEWHVTFSETMQQKFEEPKLAKWWVNTVSGSDKPFYKYENNFRSNFIPNQH